MLVIDIKENENIDRALKRYKRKYRDVQIIKEIRNRREFTKPSERRRKQRLKAIYRKRKEHGSGF